MSKPRANRDPFMKQYVERTGRFPAIDLRLLEYLEEQFGRKPLDIIALPLEQGVTEGKALLVELLRMKFEEQNQR